MEIHESQILLKCCKFISLKFLKALSSLTDSLLHASPWESRIWAWLMYLSSWGSASERTEQFQSTEILLSVRSCAKHRMIHVCALKARLQVCFRTWTNWQQSHPAEIVFFSSRSRPPARSRIFPETTNFFLQLAISVRSELKPTVYIDLHRRITWNTLIFFNFFFAPACPFVLRSRSGRERQE